MISMATAANRTKLWILFRNSNCNSTKLQPKPYFFGGK